MWPTLDSRNCLKYKEKPTYPRKPTLRYVINRNAHVRVLTPWLSGYGGTARNSPGPRTTEMPGSSTVRKLWCSQDGTLYSSEKNKLQPRTKLRMNLTLSYSMKDTSRGALQHWCKAQNQLQWFCGIQARLSFRRTRARLQEITWKVWELARLLFLIGAVRLGEFSALCT